MQVCVLRLSSGTHQQGSGRLSESARTSAPSALAHSTAPLSRNGSLEPDSNISAELVSLNEPLQPG